jgi:hypothetical protein
MTLPKSILNQIKEIDSIKSRLMDSSYSKVLQQIKDQETQYQRLVKESLSIPESAVQAIDALNASNRFYVDSLNSPFKKLVEDSLFRPPKFIDSIFGSATAKLFKELSESPLKQFNKLAYPENLIDLMVSKQIQDFEKRYKDSLMLFPSEISSALAISKMLGPVGIHAHYEEILKELKREESESAPDVAGALFSREFILSVLLSVLMFLYAKYDSEQMEKRLSNKMESVTKEVNIRSSEEHNALKQQIGQLEMLIVDLSQTQQKSFTNAEYVVKDRSALIREEPKNGSKVIAQIFPNQIVKIIDSEGKWIEVTYYDWIKSEYMNGWVLKKYLQRVKSK